MHAHLKALQKRHAELEQRIHKEQLHAARDEYAIVRMKQEKLFVKEQIERHQATG